MLPKLAAVMGQGWKGVVHAPGIAAERVARLQRVSTSSAASPAGCLVQFNKVEMISVFGRQGRDQQPCHMRLKARHEDITVLSLR